MGDTGAMQMSETKVSETNCPTCHRERVRFVPLCQERDRLRRENDELRYMVAELSEDKKRLDWMEDDSRTRSVEGQYDPSTDSVTFTIYDDFEGVVGTFPSHREAIDAAMKPTP
jgi:uncharacterized sporulation protein YeaH/YhbH (DUF444 family)